MHIHNIIKNVFWNPQLTSVLFENAFDHGRAEQFCQSFNISVSYFPEVRVSARPHVSCEWTRSLFLDLLTEA